MSKTTKIMLALGVAAGGGLMAATNTFAASTDSATTNVKAVIGESLSIEVDLSSVSTDVENGDAVVAESDAVTATVSTNANHGFTLTAEGDSLTTSGVSQSIANTGAVKNTSSYGIKVGTSGSTYQSLASAVTLKTTSAATGSEGVEVETYFGFYAASDLPAGTYAGDVTWTAVTNS